MARHLVGDYVLLSTLGQGTYGRVVHAIHSETAEEVAIKIVKKDRSQYDTHEATDVFNEIKNLLRLDHPNIIKLIKAKQSPRNIYMIMELIKGGTLHDRIDLYRRLTESVTCRYARQLISAVHHMHTVGIVHRDIKLENIMVTEDEKLVLIDFGYSTAFTHDALLSRFCGSLHYIAPEIAAHEPYNGFQVDVWSLGICIYAMHAGRYPFNAASIEDLERQLATHHRIQYPLHFSGGLKRMLNGMLSKDPRQRTTLSELVTDPWLFKYDREPLPLIAPSVELAQTENETSEQNERKKDTRHKLVTWFKKRLSTWCHR
jgi:serine/threonine protein kinase